MMTDTLSDTKAPPLQFGALIKERRRQSHLSQREFAELMHVTRNTVVNWEADYSRPDLNLIPPFACS